MDPFFFHRCTRQLLLCCAGILSLWLVALAAAGPADARVPVNLPVQTGVGDPSLPDAATALRSAPDDHTPATPTF